jgi:hypothetical protein
MTGTVRIAMWSGPRNLSTTMMRAFGARSDTACIDEPFYAEFLKRTRADHPMRDEIIAAHETDPAKIIHHLTRESPAGKVVFYQKHMVHHMCEQTLQGWLHQIRHHVMLIRHPARVIQSYLVKMDTLSLEAIGVREQMGLWLELGGMQAALPPVIDADRVLANPEGVLKRLCAVLDLKWDGAMLNWAPGPRVEDGAWAPHWYDAVWKSTGFGAAPGPLPQLSGEAARIEKEALAAYERLLEGHV